MLVWLDLPWKSCREGLVARGLRRGATQADFDALLKWAEAYWERTTPSSFSGHLAMFETFPGHKLRLTIPVTRQSNSAAPHPDPLPVKDGEREFALQNFSPFSMR